MAHNGAAELQTPDEPENLDAATSRLLMKKTWCHGQIIAAFQGMFYAYWGLCSSNMPQACRILLGLSAVALPVWTWTSWCAMHGRTSFHGKLILGFGSALLVLYIAIFQIALRDSDNPLQLAAMIVTALQFVETLAYLLVVAWLRDALVEDTSQDQYSLMPS